MGELTDKLKGRAKQVAGILIGDKELERKGEVDEVKGEVKGLANKVEHAIENAASSVKHAVKKL